MTTAPDAIHIEIVPEPRYIAIFKTDMGAVTIERIVAWVLRGAELPKRNVSEGGVYERWDDDLLDEQGNPDPKWVSSPNVRRWENLVLSCRVGSGKLRIANEQDTFEWAGHVEDVPDGVAQQLDIAVVGWRDRFGREGA